MTWDNASLADAARVMGFHVFRRVAGSGEFQKLTTRPTVYHTYYDEVKNAGLADKCEYAVLAVDAFGNQSLQSANADCYSQIPDFQTFALPTELANASAQYSCQDSHVGRRSCEAYAQGKV